MNHVATKLNQAISILSKRRRRAFLKILKMKYNSFLFYGSQLWGQSNMTNQNKIQNLQNRALRTILSEKQQDSFNQVLKKLNILIFPDLLIYKTVFLCPRLKPTKD